MALKSREIVSNLESRTFIQDDGPGTVFSLYDCQALTEWNRDYGETTRVKVKSPFEYGKSIIKKTIPGTAGDVTFTVIAYTPEAMDWLLDVDCPTDFWEVFGACFSPTDLTGYTKIRHFYRASPSSEGESGVDFLGEEEGAGVEQSTSWSADDIITIVQVDSSRARSGVTETQAFNDIAFLAEGRCEGDCGKKIDDCQWGLAVCDANYGAATANVWYTDDSGATWTLCAVDPFAANSANISSCVILPGEVAPRFIVFRGNVFSDYGARCSISDDWGATWSEVDMGGNANGSYVNGAYAHAPGLIFAVGNGGYIYYSLDRGDNWTEVTNATTGVSVELWDIHTPDGLYVYAVGDDNTIIYSTDSGASWTTKTGPADGTERLFTVQVDSKYILWVGGEVDASGECLWKSDDGADTAAGWTNQGFTGSTTASGAVRRVRNSPRAGRAHKVWIHGVVDGATQRYGPGTNSWRFFRTLDGGGSTERLDLVENAGLNGLSVCTINKAWACGEVYDALGDIQKMDIA